MFERLNAYRIMWIMVLFDLPTETAQEKRNYTQFRKKLQQNGFEMFQFSAYMRHCPSREFADKYISYLRKILPEYGHVGILCITDKQFEMMEIFYGRKKVTSPETGIQLTMF